MKTKGFLSKKNVMVSTVLLLCCLWVSLTSVAGCASGPALDKSLLTDNPCAAPCWHNITPGESSEGDVRGELEGSPFVQKSTLSYGNTERAGVPLTMFAWQDRGKEPNRIYLRDETVLRIEIYLDYNLTLGEIVDKYGCPESVYAVVDLAEFWGYLVILDYPAQGLTFSSFSYPVNYNDVIVKEGIGIVSEDLMVTRVDYYAPTSLDYALLNAFLYTPEAVELILNNAQKWEGFGQIELAEYNRW